MSKTTIFAMVIMMAATGTAVSQSISADATSPHAVVLVGSSMIGSTQVKDALFDGTDKFAKGASDVTEVNLDSKMMNMIGDSHSGLAHKIKFIVIHTYSYDKPGMYKPEDVDAYRRKLEDGTWSCAIHVREKNESTDICSRPSADHEGTEMVIMTSEPKELTFIHMSGDMSLSDLSKFGGSMGGKLKYR